MFNIIETPRNYFTRELLPDNLNSEVVLLLQRKLLAAFYLVVSCSDEVFCRALRPLW